MKVSADVDGELDVAETQEPTVMQDRLDVISTAAPIVQKVGNCALWKPLFR